MSEKVFEGLVVVEFTNAAMGPLTGKYLSDYGATVVRVESLQHPDMVRLTPPYKPGASRINASGFFAQYNTGKYSLRLNLRLPKGVEIAKKLVARSDIVIENFAPGVLDRRGLSYEELAKVNPGLIMLSMSNMGRGGPLGKHPGLGTSLMAMSGLVHLLGCPGETPNQPFGAITDVVLAPFSILILMSALDYRRRTGKGRYFEISQFEASLFPLAPLLLDSVVNDRDAEPMGNRDANAAPHGAYPCLGDDEWCAISVFDEEEWKCFCQATGNARLASDPLFATLPLRKQHEDELDAIVSAWTSTRTAREVMTILQEAGVAAGVVNNSAELLEDPQLRHRQHFQLVEHPEMGPNSVAGQASILSATPAEVKRPPLIGEHTEYILRELLQMPEKEYVDLLLSNVLE